MRTTKSIYHEAQTLDLQETTDLLARYRIAYGKPSTWNYAQRGNFRSSLCEIIRHARAERYSDWSELMKLAEA